MIADDLILYAISVFVLMAIGLGLTILEFRYGEPKRQQEHGERDANSDTGG
jgi:hypothetical protein